MSSNVGLSTPRGTGTSGYIQRNLSNLRPKETFVPYSSDQDSNKHVQRKPDQQILEHDRLREIEVKVFDLRDKLEDEGLDDEDIELQTSAFRAKLLAADVGSDKNGGGKGLKPHQVHELAAAKIEESEKLRRALGIREDYEEGSHWNKRDERIRNGIQSREREA